MGWLENIVIIGVGWLIVSELYNKHSDAIDRFTNKLKEWILGR